MKFFGLLIITSVAFCYGMFVIQYKIFPYKIAQTISRQLNVSSVKSGNVHYLHKITLFQLKENRPSDIVFIGDSMMAYGNWEELIPQLKTANRGISGDTTSGVLDRMDSIYSTQATKAFVMIGINDITNNHLQEKIIQNYITIIEGLLKHEIKPYILSTLYVGSNSSTFNNKIRELNDHLKLWTQSHQDATYVDLNISLAPKGILLPSFSIDGVHLNGMGYSKIIQAISRHL